MSNSGNKKVKQVSVVLSAVALAVAGLVFVCSERQPQAVDSVAPVSAPMSTDSNHIIVMGKRLPVSAVDEEPVASVVVTAKRERIAQVTGFEQRSVQ